MKTLPLVFVFNWLPFCFALNLLAAPPKSTERPYSQGPLKVEEFRGKVETHNTNKANTATRVRYQFEFAFIQIGQRVTVTVKSITLIAVLLPYDSWYGPEATAELLDHEQGHFDIAEINARRAELEWEQDRRAGKFISATGTSKQAAHQAVMEKLNEFGQLVDKRIAEENAEYDRSTRHGSSFSEQSEVRKIQKLTLASLVEELEQLNPKRKSSKSRPRRLDASSIP